jgi:hypothetical protein
VLYPYLNGEDLNNDPEQKPSRWVINFFDWNEEKAKTYPDCFSILDSLVKPERQRWRKDQNGNEVKGTYALRKPLPQKWWIYGEKRPALYRAISQLDQVMTINRYTKYLILDLQPNDIIFSESIVVFALNTYYDFSILSSSFHDIWAWKYSSTMGSSTLRYSASGAFETFPFPIKKSNALNSIGKELHQKRKVFMKGTNMGFTELYNIFHDKNLNEIYDRFNLIIELRSLYCELDKQILNCYGWEDIRLMHGFYELEYLPENDRVRFTIHVDARREILKRLLKLNHEVHATELNGQEQLKMHLDKKNKKKNDNISPTLFS